MIVCVCRRVSEKDIARAVNDGALDFDALQFETGVATQCGRCGDCARDVHAQACQRSFARLQSAVVRPSADMARRSA
jgi:bacterioferritin-associated ferredoxin